MRVALWTITVAGALCGALVLGSALVFGEGSAQRMGGGAIAVAMAVIPYVISRGWDELGRQGEQAAPPKRPHKECAQCFESTDARASVCRFCGSSFESADA